MCASLLSAFRVIYKSNAIGSQSDNRFAFLSSVPSFFKLSISFVCNLQVKDPSNFLHSFDQRKETTMISSLSGLRRADERNTLSFEWPKTQHNTNTFVSRHIKFGLQATNFKLLHSVLLDFTYCNRLPGTFPFKHSVFFRLLIKFCFWNILFDRFFGYWFFALHWFFFAPLLATCF